MVAGMLATMEHTSTLPAGPDEVWEILTTPDGVESWLGEGSDLPPVEGADLDVADVETGIRRVGRVETVEPGRRLGFVWWPVDGDDASGAASRVDIVLTPDADGTRLDISEIPVGTPGGAVASVATGHDTWTWRGAAVELRVAARTVGRGLTLVC